MRFAAGVILLLAAFLFAETQEAAYLRAMEAEASGDISLAVKSFEEALKIGGEYSDEIREILGEYYEALGISPVAQSSSSKGDLSFRFLGDVSAAVLNYTSSRKSDEWGGMSQGTVSTFADYTTANLIHSVGLSFSGFWNFNNRHMPALDSNDWLGSLGLEYSLVGASFLWNVGLDLNLYQKDDFVPGVFSWMEYDIYKRNRFTLKTALWGYYSGVGPASLALYGIFQKSATYGLSYSFSLGARFDADSSYDYLGYMDAYDEALAQAEKELEASVGYDENSDSKNPFDQCLELYGDQCYQWNIATIDSLAWVAQYEKIYSSINVPWEKYWVKWLGPFLRAKVAYRFRNGLSLVGGARLFYGFVVDGPDFKYERIKRISSLWTGTFSWDVGLVRLYMTLEDGFKIYQRPSDYVDFYPRTSNVFKVKLGSKWEF